MTTTTYPELIWTTLNEIIKHPTEVSEIHDREERVIGYLVGIDKMKDFTGENKHGQSSTG